MKYKYITKHDNTIELNGNVLGLDVETDGLNPRKNNVLLLQLSDGSNTYIFDTRVLKEEYIVSILSSLSDKTFIAHNAKFDMAMIYNNFGYLLEKIHDTMLAESVLYAGRDKMMKSLKDVVSERFNIELDKSMQKSFLTTTRNFTQEQLRYAGMDAELLIDIYHEQVKELDEGGFNGVMKLEHSLLPVVMKMENFGVVLSPDRLFPVLEREGERADFYEQELFEIAGREFNPRSPPQVKVVFHELAEKTGDKRLLIESTGEPVIKNINHPFAVNILKYRHSNKLVSTYGAKLLEKIEDDGKIHGDFNQIGASCITGNNLLVTSTGYKKMNALVEYSTDREFIKYEDTIVNKNFSLEKSSHAIKYKNQPTITITLQNGMVIQGTYNHPVMSNKVTKDNILHNHSKKQYREFNNNKVFVQLKDLKIGSYIEIPLNIGVFNTEYQSLEYKDVSVNKLKNEIEIPLVFNEDFAEFLGMYYADGTIRDSGGTYEIRIHNKDKDVEVEFRKLVTNLFGDIKITVEKEKGGSIRYIVRGIKLKGFSKYFPRGCHNKEIPNELLISPKTVIAAFIKGVTLDSSIYSKRNTLALSQAIKDNAVFIQNALINMGIATTISKYKSSRGIYFYRLGIRNEHYEKFKTDVGLIQQRKIKNTKATKHNKGYFILDNSWWSPVVKIEYTHDDVYDIHVPKTHSFIANGIVNHNTGRFSSSKPNLQNMPGTKEFRSIYTASEGYDFFTVDYSQIELRLAGVVSGEPKIIEEYKKPDADLHRLSAAGVYNVPRDEVTSDQRKDGKTANFECLYGSSAWSLAKKQEISIKMAEKIVNGFWGGYPTLRRYRDKMYKQTVRDEFMRTPLGRIRYFQRPAPRDPIYKYKIAAIQRAGWNMRVQGYAADIMKYAMVLVDKALGDNGRIVLTVHDEIGVELKKDHSKELSKLVLDTMEKAGTIMVRDIVPMKAEGVLMDSWTK